VGGDGGCDHAQEAPRFNGPKQTSAQVSGHASKAESHWRKACQKCGAQRIDSQIGLEPTPEAYVQSIVSVFAEVWRVLRDDGTLWLNLGDSYASSTKGDTRTPEELAAKSRLGWASGPNTSANQCYRNQGSVRALDHGLKPKDLVGIPWRVAFALQAAGWYLRSDIIWAKPNPMPESVTDRPTKAHEYLFLLSKRERYVYDAEAIREPNSPSTIAAFGISATRTPFPGTAPDRNDSGGGGLKHCGVNEDGRNKRSVWTVATQPYPEAHFATFPEALIEPCIFAGSRIGDTVLDPFCGSGTTGVVAIRHQRAFLGIELNPNYLELARTRIGNEAPLFSTEARCPTPRVSVSCASEADQPNMFSEAVPA
jgi:DNA modification methylase